MVQSYGVVHWWCNQAGFRGKNAGKDGLTDG